MDIKIKPDAEMRENILLNKVYTKLHKALFSLNSTDIGVSFPQYRIKLGHIIRLHGQQDRLITLQEMNWLGGLLGYCEITPVESVPDNVSYRVVSRKQANMTAAKLRRLLKRGSISVENAKDYKAKMFSQGLDNPYFELESASNQHKHRRYIVFGELHDESVDGVFDYFGLSKSANIPWF